MKHPILSLLLLACAAPRFAAAAPEQWTEVRSEHFTILTDANEKQGRHIADQFERMRWVFQTLFGKANVDPNVPIVVIAAKTEKTFDTMEPADRLGQRQMKIAGYYQRTEGRNYILLRLDPDFAHPYATIYHEYTHLEFSADAAWMPIWLNEGLAEFMQNTEIRDKDVLLGESSVDDILYMRQHNLIPLSVLFTVDAKSPYYHQEEKGSVFYAESWALTHFLMMADYEKHTHRMSDYISLLSHNEDPVAAAQEAFGDLKQLQSQLGDYIRNGNYKEFVLSSAAAPIDESGYEVTVLHQTEAEAIRADVLAYVGRGSEARSLADEILKQDPKNAQAYSTLGYLALKAGNSEEAQKWYGEAVKSNSTDFLSYYHYATLLLQSSGSAHGDEIESSLRTAIKLNPRFAPAYDRLGVYLSRQHENLDEARLTCLQAIQLDPGNAIFRANAANILIEMDRYAAALSVLQIATKLAKNPRETEFIQDQIAQAERLEKAHDEAEAYRSAPAVQQATARQSVVNIVPKHPTVSTNGPRRSATGIVRNVVCSYPMILEFKLEIGAGKTIALYNNEMQKIDVTAAGFTPKGTMNPCTDFEGIKARAQYVDSPDSTVNGEVIALELRK